MKEKFGYYIGTCLLIGVLFLLPYVIFENYIDITLKLDVRKCCLPIILVIGIVMNRFMSRMFNPVKVQVRSKNDLPPNFSCVLIWSEMKKTVRSYGSFLVLEFKVARDMVGVNFFWVFIILLCRKSGIPISEIIAVCLLLVLFGLLSGQAYLSLLDKYYKKTYDICFIDGIYKKKRMKYAY